ncbi:MAG: sodium:solute symporter [Planctomycetaceae bacterium]|nr:sodium:solute symporter [Planctomycetaceae bacterium]
MQLSLLDRAIIVGYLVVTVAIGFWISKRASKSIQTYFLGGNSIPWYMLGLSNASGMFDISGTMWMVYLLFVYGAKSIWIPWLWPVFNQVFMMAFLSIWLRRSGVMTGAEWIRFRFGDNRGAQLAHLVVVVFALVNVIGFLAYGFIGIGKSAATFLPWDYTANQYGLIITAITTLYVVKGGMFSVVFTEVLQFVIMTIACVWVGVIAMQRVAPETLAAVTPAGWQDLFFSARLNLDWSGLLPAANAKIASDGWELFAMFVGLMFFKGVLQSVAGPAPNYDMQRVLSARSPREAAYMSGIVNVVLLVPRYMLVTGLTVLALAFFMDQLRAEGAEVDFEVILPLAMREFMPSGLLGLLVAALLAAFMSTYAATVNAAPAYVVNDIYKRYLRPDAPQRTYVAMSYTVSIVVVLIGTVIGLYVKSLNDIVQWIVTALYGGYTAANLLKWIWWRFNSYGYFWGMASGMLAAGVVPQAAKSLAVAGRIEPIAEIYLFPLIFLISLVGCVAGSLLTPADDLEVLKRFYLKVRPWGFWGPVHDAVVAEHPQVQPNRNCGRDMLNCLVGMAWQTALTAVGVFLVLQDYRKLAVSLGVVAAGSAFLKFNWLDRIEDYPADLPQSEMASGDVGAAEANPT